MAGVNSTGLKTFLATEALAAYRRVKLTAASGTHVEYADAGEVHIGVTTGKQDTVGGPIEVALTTKPGTVKVEAAGAFDAGATLYGAADGKVDDVSSGSVIGRPTTAASGSASIVEMLPENSKPTTAGATSITDAGDFTAETTVEAALQELYQNAVTAAGVVSVPLTSITREDGTALTKQATTVAGFEQIGNKELVIDIPVDCTAGEALAFNIALPRDLDDAADVIIDVLVSKAANLDALTLDAEAYFVAAGDLQNDDAQDTAAQTIVAAGTVLSFTCGADGVPAAPCALTGVLTLGGTNDGDAVYIHAVWIRYTKKILAA